MKPRKRCKRGGLGRKKGVGERKVWEKERWERKKGGGERKVGENVEWSGEKQDGLSLWLDLLQ